MHRIKGFFVTVCFVTILVTSAGTRWEKWKLRKDLVVPIVDQNREDFNTVPINNELISPTMGFVVFVVAFLGSIQYMIVKYVLPEELSKLLESLLMGLLPMVINYTVLPLACYWINPELRKYVRNLV